LRKCGHEVYDFRNPAPNNNGFKWQQVNINWNPGDDVSTEEYRKMLNHPIAIEGYKLDIEALRSCDAVVYVLPCGKSASWEFGYAMGQGKPGYVIRFDETEPDLMFREATIIGNMNEFFEHFGEPIENKD
jgi:nucleoside 2-deoxyribosyltransferase